MNMLTSAAAIILAFITVFTSSCSRTSLVYPVRGDQTLSSAPMMTYSPGHGGTTAITSVFRITCPKKRSGGTAFLHKSGRVITAAHIVEGTKPNEVFLTTPKGKKIKISAIVTDFNLDLALLTPQSKIRGNCFPISSELQFSVGDIVSFWGYPSGYGSRTPLLGVGYLAGIDTLKAPSGKARKRWVVNAAINRGNSGGPLVHVESGKVIGVVSSKLAPMPAHIENALKQLKKSKNITQFTRTHPDGTKEKVSTANVVEEVLQYLRSQTQLVIGHTVLLGDLRDFLKANGLDP